MNANLAPAYEGLGDIYLKNKMEYEAVKSYEEAVKIEPYLVTANIKLGNIFKQNAMNDKALACYDAALKTDAENLSALHNKAATLFDLKRNDDAKNCYYKILSISKDFSMAYYGLGVIAEKEKNYNEAISKYTKFTELTDNSYLKSTIQRRIDLLKTRI